MVVSVLANWMSLILILGIPGSFSFLFHFELDFLNVEGATVVALSHQYLQ